MKKAIYGFMMLVLLAAQACKKENDTGGSWTFKGVTYNIPSCAGSTATGNPILTATGSGKSSTTNATLLCGFSTPEFPAASGTYVVSDGAGAGPHQVGLDIYFGPLYTSSGVSGSYYATGGNGSNQTVSVTVSNGEVSVSGSGIEMVNSNPPYDSSTLQLNIHLLQ